MQIKIAGITFFENFLAFHFTRVNIYSPWNCIGVMLVNDRMYECKYDRKNRHIEDQFQKTFKNIESDEIRFSRDALEHYRKPHQNALSVISPIIRYMTVNKYMDFSVFYIQMYRQYVRTISPKAFYYLTLMLKMRNAYFPQLVYGGRDKIHNDIAQQVYPELRRIGMVGEIHK